MTEKPKRSFNRMENMPFIIGLGWALILSLWFPNSAILTISRMYGDTLTIASVIEVAGKMALAAALAGATVGLTLRFVRANFGLIKVLLLSLGCAVIIGALMVASFFFVSQLHITRYDFYTIPNTYFFILLPLSSALAGGTTAWLTIKLLSITPRDLEAIYLKYLMRRWIVGFFGFPIILIAMYFGLLLFSSLLRVTFTGVVGEFILYFFVVGIPGFVSGVICGRALRKVLDGIMRKTHEA